MGKTLLIFHVKQDALLRRICTKYRDVAVFCRELKISRQRFYQYTNPKVKHRIYASGPDHLLWKMTDLLDIKGTELNDITTWESGKNGEE